MARATPGDDTAVPGQSATGEFRERIERARREAAKPLDGLAAGDKDRLHREARRVLAPDGRLALWDVTTGPNQPPRFPVPWADRPELSHLVAPLALRDLLVAAGFEAIVWNDLTEPAVQAVHELVSAPRQPPSLQVFVPHSRPKQTASSITSATTGSGSSKPRCAGAVPCRRRRARRIGECP